MTSKTATKDVSKNAVPILMYYDIFKNYYANTQEDNFYIIGNTEELTITINGKEVNTNVIPSNEGRVNNAGIITISPNTKKQNEIQIKVSKNYYANTQEEKLYINRNTEELEISINGTPVNPNVIPSNLGRVNNSGTITIKPKTIKQSEIQIKVSKKTPTGKSEILAPGDIGTWKITWELS